MSLRYPIVLVHGFMGYDRCFFWRMFSQVKAHLEKHGCCVLQPQLHPSRSIEYRAEQLQAFIEDAFGLTSPVHLIGHSLGGLDARFVASSGGRNCGDRVCTVTTLGTPHRGSLLAPRIPRAMTWSVARLARLIKTANRVVRIPEQERIYFSYLAEDEWEALKQLTPEYMENYFNQKIKDHPNVVYLSYGGDVSAVKGAFLPRIRTMVGKKFSLFTGVHDGLVEEESARWGIYGGLLPADHGAMIGLQIVPWLFCGFSHLPFFEQLLYNIAQYEQNS
jgi:triacylglycerol lipase